MVAEPIVRDRAVPSVSLLTRLWGAALGLALAGETAMIAILIRAGSAFPYWLLAGTFMPLLALTALWVWYQHQRGG